MHTLVVDVMFACSTAEASSIFWYNLSHSDRVTLLGMYIVYGRASSFRQIVFVALCDYCKKFIAVRKPPPRMFFGVKFHPLPCIANLLQAPIQIESTSLSLSTSTSSFTVFCWPLSSRTRSLAFFARSAASVKLDLVSSSSVFDLYLLSSTC